MNFSLESIRSKVIGEKILANGRSMAEEGRVILKDIAAVGSRETEIKGTVKELAERFNRAFERASDKGIILGSYWKETYFSHFRDIDYVGLEQYMEMAEHYASVILQKNKTEEEKAYSKKLKIN